MVNRYVVVDLGGTHTRVALATSARQLQQTIRIETLAEQGPEATLQRLEQAIRQVAGAAWVEVEAVGVVAPCPVDPWQGRILRTCNLPGWENLPLKERLSSRLDRPVVVGNDANLAALGEQRFGAGQGQAYLIYLTISTGIGGGVLINGQLLLGVAGVAAEVGHMVLEADGPACICGSQGCLEALASGTAIARDARAMIQSGQANSLLVLAEGDPERITARLVGRAAKAGNLLALDLLQRAGFYIGLGLVNLLNLFNPAIVVIGGGVSQVGDLLFNPIRQTVQTRLDPLYWAGCPIVPAALGDDAGLWGALAMVADEFD